jgi:hypothetical protein
MSCVLFVIDESTALAARVADGTKSKADCLATALNALLSQLAAGPRIDVALVGYRLADDAVQDVGCRWGGPLEGRQLVSTAELEACPRAVENRVRKIPGPGGYGVTREETVRFPIWYVPLLKAPGSRRTALEFCRDLIAQGATAGPCGSAGEDGQSREGEAPAEPLGALSDSTSIGSAEASPSRPRDQGSPSATAPVPPLLVHLLAELSDEQGFRAVGEVLAGLDSSGRRPLVFHGHLGSSSRVPATAYPSSDANLSPELLRHAFHASSILPEPLAANLRAAGVPLNRGARGLIHNARLVDLIRLLGLVKAYAAWANEPQAERAEAPPSPALPHETSLVAFVLDRSCATPDTSPKDPKSAWRRLQDRANELIGQLARQAKGTIQAAIVAYGADPSGAGEVTTGFVGPMAGRTWLGSSELAGGAIRVDEFSEQVSNGIGGLLTISRKRPVFFDLGPAAPASPAAAFAKVAEMLIQWAEAHPGIRAQPVVVHCTRGEFAPDAVRQSVARLREAERATGSVALYHVVVTESPHRAILYPAAPDGIEHDALRALWELTSPLPGGAALAGKRPGVSADSRGMVINAAFDALTDALGFTGPGS